MKSVFLEGVLGEKFGREWHLDVNSPAEAIRAIEANRPGFAKYLIDSEADGVRYRMLLGGEEIDAERMLGPISTRESFHLVPVLAGADSRGFVKMIIGAIIVVAAFALGQPEAAAPVVEGGSATGMGAGIWGTGFTYANLAQLGAAVMLSGVSMAMASHPDLGSGEKDPSNVFDGPVNTVTQGGPVPIGYGRLLVGSILISGGIRVDEMPVASKPGGGIWPPWGG